MMTLSKRWMTLILLILGAMIASGCAITKDSMMEVNEARDAFQKATLAGGKTCAPCEYATAEAFLALADHEVAERDEYSPHFTHGPVNSVKIAKEKALEAIKLCQKPPAPPAPAPPPPPPPPPPPAPAKPVFDTIYFDINKSNINPVAAKALDRNGMLLKDNPKIKVEIGGHSDNSGDEKANMAISVKRAESAKKYIMDKFNIPGDRMVVKGYGSSKPIADNSTAEGRAKNRRVEFKILE